MSGVVVGSGIVEKPSADARRSDKRKTSIVLLVWNRTQVSLSPNQGICVFGLLLQGVCRCWQKSGM